MKGDSPLMQAPPRIRPTRRTTISSFLLILVGFTLTSTTYIEWLYRLMEFAPPETADALTLIGGYSLQALGIAVTAVIGRRWFGIYSRVPFVLVVALHFACAVPATMGTSFAGVLVFGYLMNVFCGMIAAYYLHGLLGLVPAKWRGIVFGGGYGCSILISWLARAVPAGAGDALGSLILGLVLSVVAVVVAFRPIGGNGVSFDGDGRLVQSGPLQEPAVMSGDMRTVVAFAVCAVLLISLVKNVGFSFPTADIVAGVSLELSRLFYAVGLVIAGIVCDRNRRFGLICCVVALITPFICMALANEPLSGTAMWAIDYFFFGFFSVFRVVLFADIAEDSQRGHLSGFGLMVGRIGDAMGTAVCLALGNSTVVLLVVATALFAASVFVMYRLSQLMFQPERVLPKSGEQLFEEFAVRYDLSLREREVMRLLLTESSNAEIASALFITESTVKFHMHNLLKKTDCKNRQELRALYTSFGM